MVGGGVFPIIKCCLKDTPFVWKFDLQGTEFLQMTYFSGVLPNIYYTMRPCLLRNTAPFSSECVKYTGKYLAGPFTVLVDK